MVKSLIVLSDLPAAGRGKSKMGKMILTPYHFLAACDLFAQEDCMGCI